MSQITEAWAKKSLISILQICDSHCYQIKVGVRLPTATCRQIVKAEVGEKGKRSFSNAVRSVRMAESSQKPILSWKPRGNPSHPQPDQNQRQQHPYFLLPFKMPFTGSHRWLLSGHPGRPQALSLEPVYGAGSAIGHVASRTRSSRKHTGQYIHEMASTSLPFLGFILVFHVDSFPGPNFQVLWEGPASNQSLLFSKLD